MLPQLRCEKQLETAGQYFRNPRRWQPLRKVMIKPEIPYVHSIKINPVTQNIVEDD